MCPVHVPLRSQMTFQTHNLQQNVPKKRSTISRHYWRRRVYKVLILLTIGFWVIHDQSILFSTFSFSFPERALPMRCSSLERIWLPICINPPMGPSPVALWWKHLDLDKTPRLRLLADSRFTAVPKSQRRKLFQRVAQNIGAGQRKLQAMFYWVLKFEWLLTLACEHIECVDIIDLMK